MKKIKKILLFVVVTAVLMLGFVFGVSAVTGDDYKYEVLDDGSVSITGYTGNSSNIEIPSELNGRTVTTIGTIAFLNRSDIKSVKIPESVKYIWDRAFNGCTGLESVIIPGNVNFCTDETGVSHSESAFGGCTGLKSLTVEDGVSKLGIYTFAGCSSLETVKIGSNITTIGHKVFGNCTNLSEIIISDDIENITYSAFSKCNNITDIYYEGSKEEWEKVVIGDDNGSLLDATVHYNYNPAHTHTYISAVTEEATCAAKGTKTFICSCGDTYTEEIASTGKHTGGTATCKEKAKCTVCKQAYGNLKSHIYATSTIKATLSKDGKVESKCTVCGNVSSSTAINKIKSVKLSATSYTYNNKTKTPTVTVKDSKGNTLKKGTDYTVTYPKKRKSVGRYTVTVTFKGNYSGTKKLTFEIVPKKVTLSKLTAGKKQLTATWKTVSGVTGYEVQYSTSKKFTKKTVKTVTIKKAKTKKTTIKKLTKGKKYYVKVRAYKTVSGKKIYGAYSAVKNVKVK